MSYLLAYCPKFEENTLRRIADFFSYHHNLIEEAPPLTQKDLENAHATLLEWTGEGHGLYVIMREGQDAGFLHLGFRGDIVAWIEDIYVDPACRSQGIASCAIRDAEEIVRQTSGYTAVCMDVAPRNAAALRLYHRLGFDSISLITLRKELGENKRDQKKQFLGYTFNI